MCGIVGIIGRQEPDWIERMNMVQRHRGPDDQGIYLDADNQVSLAMRRLSIVDLVEGHQPMIDIARERVVVFNGEIFNAPMLRKELASKGYKFYTKNSDTEVLLYLYDVYGHDMIKLLNGMFAFVIYDRRTKTLFGGRDHAGIKPFYWFHGEGRFAFASEIKSLLALPFVKRELDMQSTHHYFTFQFIPPPNSIFKSIFKLPAAHSFLFRLQDNNIEIERYWRPPLPSQTEGVYKKDREEVVKELRGHLRVAVRDWLMSDVPIGCSLSGGLDSSIVVGLMAELGKTPIRTWTLGFEEGYAKDLDERNLARKVAKRYNTDHHEIVVRADSLLDDLDKMVCHLGEPYAGGLPSWFVFREMSREVKVAMTGTGGDELFGNYGKWLVYRPISPGWIGILLKRLYSNGIRNLMDSPHGALYHGYFGEREKSVLWANDIAGFLQTTPSLIERMWLEAGSNDPRNSVPYIDFNLQLPEEFLLMTDRFSMAWSLEARTPFLDKRLIEFVLNLPASTRTSRYDLKGLLKKAVSDLLPAELLCSRKKGFMLPVGEWLRGPLRPMVEEFLGPAFISKQGLFSPTIYNKYVVPHLCRRHDNTDKIWTLLMFQLWWEKYLKNNVTEV